MVGDDDRDGRFGCDDADTIVDSDVRVKNTNFTVYKETPAEDTEHSLSRKPPSTSCRKLPEYFKKLSFVQAAIETSARFVRRRRRPPTLTLKQNGIAWKLKRKDC